MEMEQRLRGEAAVVTEYVARVREQLADLALADREGLLARLRARIELESDLQAVPVSDESEMRSVLQGIGTPEQAARSLRPDGVQAGAPAAGVRTGACERCGAGLAADASFCAHCGRQARPWRRGTGYEWKSPATFRGWPLVHVAWGRDQNGKLRVARGVIAIGQFGIGAITIAQFGIGFVFGLGQFMLAPLSVGQFAFGLLAAGQFGIGLLAGAGQFATGIFSAGMKAFGLFTRSAF
ncbi:MAG: zinc ribbon domain-containing protein [Chthonomonadales bacterium]|nr:zinc ribbon domain-containing protein [Chthonomonadales bacterium]